MQARHRPIGVTEVKGAMAGRSATCCTFEGACPSWQQYGRRESWRTVFGHGQGCPGAHSSALWNQLVLADTGQSFGWIARVAFQLGTGKPPIDAIAVGSWANRTEPDFRVMYGLAVIHPKRRLLVSKAALDAAEPSGLQTSVQPGEGPWIQSHSLGTTLPIRLLQIWIRRISPVR